MDDEYSYDDVILNIYKLSLETEPPSTTTTTNTNNNSRRSLRFLDHILTPLGLGSYHTSLTLHNNETYSFAAEAGITKTNHFRNDIATAPSNATLQERIVLGRRSLTRGEVNTVVNGLRTLFHGESYHLANRNCNHFTETFATAVLMGEELIAPSSKSGRKLATYPQWVNRLAKTGTRMGLDCEGSCNVWEEARIVTGADKKVRHDLVVDEKSGGGKDRRKGTTKKKELTEKQKAVLAKLKQKS